MSAPRPDRIPAGLPLRLLPDLLARRRMLLLLDYDGTISNITRLPSRARPVARARELIAELASHPERVVVAIISGRRIDQLRRLICRDRGLMLAGAHGLEVVDSDGRRFFAVDPNRYAAELAKIRAWMARNIPQDRGFVVEDKGTSVALHYRGADPAEALALRRRLKAFAGRQTRRLKLGRGKMMLEAMPAEASKALAVAFIRRRVGKSPLPVYFGDDLTDEDAFFALRKVGIGILVGRRRRSWARYRVDSPADVTRVLADMVAAVERAGAQRAAS